MNGRKIIFMPKSLENIFSQCKWKISENYIFLMMQITNYYQNYSLCILLSNTDNK